MFVFVVQKQAVEKSFPPKAETNPTMASQICLQDGVETRGNGGKDLKIHSGLPQQQRLGGAACFVNSC